MKACEHHETKYQSHARIFRGIVAFIFLSPCLSNPARSLVTEAPKAVHGTLIIYVATNNGLIVAADSRSTVGLTIHCDDTDKIVPLRKHSRSVVAVGGQDMLVIGKVKPQDDLCKYRKTHPPYVRFSTLARDFLDAQSGDIGEKDFRNLETHVLSKLQTLSTQQPNGVRHDPDGILTLTFGNYDVKGHVSIFGMFRICGDASVLNHSFICDREWIRIAKTDEVALKRIGEIDCLNNKVVSPSGRQLLGPDFLNDFDHFVGQPRTVSQLTTKEALAVAVDLIKSAERMGDLTSYPSCTFVGGPIKAVLLDESHPAPFKLQ